MNRRGSSMVFVLIVLAVLGSLAGVLFNVLRVRHLGGERALRAARVRGAADGESARVLAQWDGALADSLSIGEQRAVSDGGRPAGTRLFDSLLRLDRDLYLVRVVAEERATDGSLLARDGVARLARIARPTVSDSQAVLATGPVVTQGVPLIAGEDHVPDGWSGACPAPSAPSAGVHSGADPPTLGACDSGTCLTGLPPATADTNLQGSSLDRLPGFWISGLAEFGDKEASGLVSGIGPILAGGGCDFEAPLNWGDPGSPTAPCGRYFPVVVAQPMTTVTDGAGQGVLLATGPLELGGDLVYDGVIFARGPVTIRDRAVVVGTVLSEDTVRVEGDGRVLRSRCAVRRALEGAVRPAGSSRSWFSEP